MTCRLSMALRIFAPAKEYQPLVSFMGLECQVEQFLRCVWIGNLNSSPGLFSDTTIPQFLHPGVTVTQEILKFGADESRCTSRSEEANFHEHRRLEPSTFLHGVHRFDQHFRRIAPAVGAPAENGDPF